MTLKYRVILVEHDAHMLSELAGALRASSVFDLAAAYQETEPALGRSSVFRPNLFLVDVDHPESLEYLSRFSELFPKASVLGLMEQWDADLADRALEAGVMGCILKPFHAEDVVSAMELYKRRGQPKPARTFAFFSPKGRSGRTTLASILAMELARMSGEAVCLIDADLQFGDLPMFFDVRPPHNVVEATHDVKLLTPSTLEPYFERVGNGVWLLSSPVRPEHAELVEVESLVDVVHMAGTLFRYVLVDLPAGFNPISIAVSDFADTDFLMTMLNSGQEIRHMSRSMSLFQVQHRYGKRVYSLFTRVNPCTEEQRKKIEASYGHVVDDILPNEYRVTATTSSGRLAKELPVELPLIQYISRIAQDIVNGKR